MTFLKSIVDVFFRRVELPPFNPINVPKEFWLTELDQEHLRQLAIKYFGGEVVKEGDAEVDNIRLSGLQAITPMGNIIGSVTNEQRAEIWRRFEPPYIFTVGIFGSPGQYQVVLYQEIDL